MLLVYPPTARGIRDTFSFTVGLPLYHFSGVLTRQPLRGGCLGGKQGFPASGSRNPCCRPYIRTSLDDLKEHQVLSWSERSVKLPCRHVPYVIHENRFQRSRRTIDLSVSDNFTYPNPRITEWPMPVSVSLMLLLIALGWVCVIFSFFPLTKGYYITVTVPVMHCSTFYNWRLIFTLYYAMILV